MKTLNHLVILGSALVLLALDSPSATPSQTAGAAQPADWYGDATTKLITLDQGWSAEDRDWFYSATQGSHLLPYEFFINLEQADSEQPFRDDHNMRKFRCLPQPPSPLNQDGLPVGFVADEGSTLPKGLLTDQRSLGFTCAACHTGQLNYKGTAIRIDGGPTLADMDGLLNAMTAALKSTLTDKAKLERFSQKVLGTTANDAKKAQLQSALKATVEERVDYQKRNQTDHLYGFARLDAFGRIFNTALALVDQTNGVKADAPVSFPQLWDSPHADTVQWTGNASNAGAGALARNVGEVIGVFAAIDTTQIRPPNGYGSSARIPNLLALEERLKKLISPMWPEILLPHIDHDKVEAGKKLYYEKGCVECHQEYNRSSALPGFKSILTPIEELRTDAEAAQNIRDGSGKTGILMGGPDLISGEIYGATAAANQITKDTITRILVGDKPSAVSKQSLVGEPTKHLALNATGLNQIVDAKGLHQEPHDNLQYRSRPLNGIWATAPFLHNGSVPTLYDLLLPEDERPKKFYVGRREFDPVKVGYLTEEKKEGAFEFDTALKGNSNKGHNYGKDLTDEQRWQLVEYLKTL